MSPDTDHNGHTASDAFQDLDITDVVVWRYPEMCEHWNVSRATVERWVRRYEQDGDGIPVHRDPSGRPYWLAHEASASAGRVDHRPSPPSHDDDDELRRLRRAARRGYHVA